MRETVGERNRLREDEREVGRREEELEEWELHAEEQKRWVLNSLGLLHREVVLWVRESPLLISQVSLIERHERHGGREVLS